MREILFRAKDTNNGKWVEGSYYFCEVHAIDEYHGIIPTWSNSPNFSLTVDPETVGQYTGLKDKHYRMIFEGDVVRVTDDNSETWKSDTGIGKIIFLDGMWYVDGQPQNSLYDIDKVYYIEVIGNIHDNPELLGAE